MQNLIRHLIDGVEYFTPGHDIYTKYGSNNSRQKRRVQRIVRLIRFKLAYNIIGRKARTIIWQKAQIIAFFASYFEYKNLTSLCKLAGIKRQDWKRSRARRWRQLLISMLSKFGLVENVMSGATVRDAVRFINVFARLRILQMAMRMCRRFFGSRVLEIPDDELTIDYLRQHASPHFVRIFLKETEKSRKRTKDFILDIQGNEANKLLFLEMTEFEHPVMDVLLSKIILVRTLLHQLKEVATFSDFEALVNKPAWLSCTLDLTKRRMSKGIQKQLAFNRINKIVALLGMQIINNNPIVHETALTTNLAVRCEITYEFGLQVSFVHHKMPITDSVSENLRYEVDRQAFLKDAVRGG